MPHIEPLKPSAKQDRPKIIKQPPPGAGPIKQVSTKGRDPRGGQPAKDRNPNRAYG